MTNRSNAMRYGLYSPALMNTDFSEASGKIPGCMIGF